MEKNPDTRTLLIEDLLEICRAHDLSADLATMFRSPALRCRGKVFAFIGFDGTLIVKLPHDRIVELARDGLAEPVTMGKRTMREWAEVPPLPDPNSTEDVWAGLVVQAHQFVSSQLDK